MGLQFRNSCATPLAPGGEKGYSYKLEVLEAPGTTISPKAGDAPLELDYDALLGLTSELGYRLMESGAEIYRVEESVHRLLQAYGVTTGEVFAIPNLVIVSLTDPGGHPVTRVRRIPPHGTDIYLLEAYNNLCRQLCREAPPFDQAMERLNAIWIGRRTYSVPAQLAAYFVGAAAFTVFFGGSARDALCGGLCGVSIGLCLWVMTRLGTNLFFKTVAGGMISALVAIVLTLTGLGERMDLIIIGALMALVPGIAFTNAMRDIMAGDLVAGITKVGEALLIGGAIAIGTSLAFGLVRLLGGAV